MSDALQQEITRRLLASGASERVPGTGRRRIFARWGDALVIAWLAIEASRTGHWAIAAVVALGAPVLSAIGRAVVRPERYRLTAAVRGPAVGSGRDSSKGEVAGVAAAGIVPGAGASARKARRRRDR